MMLLASGSVEPIPARSIFTEFYIQARLDGGAKRWWLVDSAEPDTAVFDQNEGKVGVHKLRIGSKIVTFTTSPSQSPLSKAFGPEVAGVIGVDVLKKLILYMDYFGGKAALLKDSKPITVAKVFGTKGIRLPLEEEKDVFYFTDCQIGGKPFRFALGSTALRVLTDQSQLIPLRTRGSIFIGEDHGMESMIDDTFYLESFRAGPIKIPFVVASNTATEEPQVSPTCFGPRCVLDLPDSKLIVQDLGEMGDEWRCMIEVFAEPVHRVSENLYEFKAHTGEILEGDLNHTPDVLRLAQAIKAKNWKLVRKLAPRVVIGTEGATQPPSTVNYPSTLAHIELTTNGQNHIFPLLPGLNYVPAGAKVFVSSSAKIVKLENGASTITIGGLSPYPAQVWKPEQPSANCQPLDIANILEVPDKWSLLGLPDGTLITAAKKKGTIKVAIPAQEDSKR